MNVGKYGQHKWRSGPRLSESTADWWEATDNDTVKAAATSFLYEEYYHGGN